MDETFSVKANNHFVWVSYLKRLQWLFEMKCKKLFSALKTKVHSIFVHGFTLVEHFLFSPDFQLCFLYSTNPIQIKSCLYYLRAAGTRSSTQQEHFPFSVVDN